MQGTSLGPRGYTIIKTEENAIEIDKIRRELTVSPINLQDYGGQPTEFRLYLESPKKLFIPKAYGLSKFGLPEVDKVPVGKPIDINFTGKLRELQVKATDAILGDCRDPLKRGGILCLQCGEGKCLAKNTPVLLYNRQIIMVQDITVEHKLLGDDLKIRNILSICSGYDDMYEIVPNDRRFMRFTVNSVHILSLLYEYSDGQYTDIDISIKEYLRLPYSARDKFYAYKAGKVQKSRFEIFKSDYAQYYGFVIDGNHRFLLGDTTVTHNTISAIYMITELKKKTLIIVHKEFLMQQWCERIKEFTSDARVGILRGQTIDIKNKDIVIAMLQSLSMKDYDENILEGFGTVVLDECFPYSQSIITEIGPMKIGKIYNIWKNGEILPKVLSYNENSKLFEYKKITYAWKKIYITDKNLIEFQFNNNNVKSTPDHKYLSTEYGMIEARYLKVGDTIVSTDGSQTIKYITYMANKDPEDSQHVYDIEVENNHNFVCLTNTNEGIVVSNCHHTSAEVFSRALKKVNFEYSIGLTATPNRKDGLTKVFKWYLGDIGYMSKRRTDEVDVKIYKYYDNNPDYSEEERIYNGKVNMSKMINNICAFPPRVEYIVDIIVQVLKDEPERRIMLVSDRKSHLVNIGDLLKLKNYDPGYYYGGLKEWQLKAAEVKNILLCTIQFTSEGLDIKGLDTLILASPKSDIIQISGRILRDKPEDRKHTPLIIDILDDFSVFVNQGKKRRAYYKKCKYNIIEPDSLKDIKQNINIETVKYDGCVIEED